jgi:hypothetical protein
MTTDWILRVGNGQNFINGTRHHLWGIKGTSPTGKHFVANVKPGDRLWFVKSKTHGQILGVATYRSHNSRNSGLLINDTLTDEEIGWDNVDGLWQSCDIEIHYTNLYNVSKCELLTHIIGPSTIRKYSEKCRVDLAVEYTHICRYSSVTTEF